MAEFYERQVLHNEEWTNHLCNQAFTQGLTPGIAPKARPVPRDSKAAPKPAPPEPAPAATAPIPAGTENYDPCWVCDKPYSMLFGETQEVTQQKYGTGRFCSLTCRDKWHHENHLADHGERGWPDSDGIILGSQPTGSSSPSIRLAMDPELLEGGKVKAEEKEDRIKAEMAIIADKSRCSTCYTSKPRCTST